MSKPSGFTFAEACEYIRVECGLTHEQIAGHQAAIKQALQRGFSIIEVTEQLRPTGPASGSIAPSC